MGKIFFLIVNIFLILAIIFNLNWLHSPYWGVFVGLTYLIIFGFLLTKIIFPAQETFWQAMIGILSFISLYSFLGALVYYIYRLDQIVVNILFALISGLILYFSRFKIYNFRFKLPKIKLHTSYFPARCSLSEGEILLTFSYLILFAVAIITLLSVQTADAIRSPWQVIPKAFFVVYFLATVNLFLIIFKSADSKLQTSSFGLRTLIGLHFFLTTSVALLIYKLGFGFDPFIHQATELAIFKHGLILPKPLYYLGQYSIVVILSHLLQISVEWIDKLLLPILLSIFLPYTIYSSLVKTFNWGKNQALILSLIFLALPFELFIVTNPQAIANLLALIILFLSFLYLKNREIPFWLLGFLTLTALAIHALAGIPIAIYLILVWLISHKNKITIMLIPIFTILAAISLPLALYINSLISAYKIQITWHSFDLFAMPTIFSKQFNYFLDFAYLYQNNLHLLILIASSLTLYYLLKHYKIFLFIPGLLTFFILIINAILLNFIEVSQIIDYEQKEFSLRIFQFSFYFLLPILIYGFYLIFQKIGNWPFIYKLLYMLVLSLLLSFSIYLSYPRFDDYDNSKFINVAAADFQTVNFIEQNSNGQPYIVLCNQMTSAAALKTFGFDRNYNGQYFYPIPTGGQLYKYYEAMIYQEASAENMQKAMDFTGVNLAYFVLPFYWSHFEDIRQQAQASANQSYNLNDKVMIYKYSK